MSQGCQIHNFFIDVSLITKIANKGKLMLLPWFDACGGELSTLICLFMCVEVVCLRNHGFIKGHCNTWI